MPIVLYSSHIFPEERFGISELMMSSTIVALYKWFNLTVMLPLLSHHPVLISPELLCFSTTEPSDVCEMYVPFPVGQESTDYFHLHYDKFSRLQGLRLKYELMTSESESRLCLPAASKLKTWMPVTQNKLPKHRAIQIINSRAGPYWDGQQYHISYSISKGNCWIKSRKLQKNTAKKVFKFLESFSVLLPFCGYTFWLWNEDTENSGGGMPETVILIFFSTIYADIFSVHY